MDNMKGKKGRKRDKRRRWQKRKTKAERGKVTATDVAQINNPQKLIQPQNETDTKRQS